MLLVNTTIDQELSCTVQNTSIYNNQFSPLLDKVALQKRLFFTSCDCFFSSMLPGSLATVNDPARTHITLVVTSIKCRSGSKLHRESTTVLPSSGREEKPSRKETKRKPKEHHTMKDSKRTGRRTCAAAADAASSIAGKRLTRVTTRHNPDGETMWCYSYSITGGWPNSLAMTV
ncbi:hypothetical protein MRX96_051998 [Rhipicephalus microplus]